MICDDVIQYVRNEILKFNEENCISFETLSWATPRMTSSTIQRLAREGKISKPNMDCLFENLPFLDNESYKIYNEFMALFATDEKHRYDKAYRSKNKEKIKKRKAEYFKKTYDPEKQSRKRKTPEYRRRHREYCSKPEYAKWKKEYDRKLRCKKKYGEYWEAGSLLIDIENLLKPDKYKIDLQKGRFNKSGKRKRNYEKIKRCELERCFMGNIKQGQIRQD